MALNPKGAGASLLSTVPEAWPGLVDAVEKPEAALGLQGSSWDGFLAGLRANGLLPLAYRAMRDAAVLPRLAPACRSRIEAAMAAHLATWTVSWAEIDRLLAALAGAGLHPIPIKGADLSIRAYPEPHLRPISDLDVLFPSLEEAERAYALLQGLGYRSESPGLSGAPWALSHHLPALENPANKFQVEVHGSILWTPRDGRWEGGASRLLEGRDSFTYKGVALEGLRAEANLIFLCAHMFLLHADVQPKAIVLFDLRYLLQCCEQGLDWQELSELAAVTRMETPTYKGLALAHQLLGVPVPANVLEALRARADFGAISLDNANSQKVVNAVMQAKGFTGPFLLAFHMIFPSAPYMRFRYPERAGWPIAMLYLFRWWSQAKKLAKWAGAKVPFS